MKAEDKTKELPIDELVELRQRISQLEKEQTYLQSGLARTPEGTSFLEVL